MNQRHVIKLLIIVFLLIVLIHLFNKIQEGATRNVQTKVNKATAQAKQVEKIKEAPKVTAKVSAKAVKTVVKKK
jgi:hypothetical protein